MRTPRIAALAAGFLLLAAPSLAPAADPHAGHGSAHGAAAPAGAQGGVLIRESTVAGHRLAYRLYSWAERNVMMKEMIGMTMAGMNEKGTHHLMVFFTGADGKPATGAKVGFQLTGPDGAVQKTLTMGMFDGYGADVVLATKGAYAVKLKADFGGKVVAEDFVYTLN